MTLIYQNKNITVKRYDFVHGAEYRVSDGVHEFSVGEICPALDEYSLQCMIEDYLNMRWDDLRADCEEREEHHMIDND